MSMVEKDIEKNPKKTCFVICPIGKENSKERQWSDDVLECIISPVVEKLGYNTPIRADRINESGIITRQIIELLIDSDLVIADLSWRNPNVFYELAIRHVTKKPCIHIIRVGEDNPFDTSSNRAITFNLDIRSARKAMEELENHISSIKSGKVETDNPIGTALTMRNLEKSGDTEQYSIAQVIQELKDVRAEIKSQHTIYPKVSALPFPSLDAITTIPAYASLNNPYATITDIGGSGYAIAPGSNMGCISRSVIESEIATLKFRLNTSVMTADERAVYERRIHELETSLKFY